MTDLAERLSLAIRELQSPFKLGLHDAVFGDQIFVSRQQLLVHRSRHKGQDARPIHIEPPSPTLGDGIMDRPKNCTGPPQEPLSDAAELTGFSAASVF
jgi:hypothetical protein